MFKVNICRCFCRWQALHLLLQSLTLVYNAKKAHTKTQLMCTQREILQNDLLRSAKLGPWQKKAATEDGRSFYLFGIFSCFSLCSFSTGQIRVLSHRCDRINLPIICRKSCSSFLSAQYDTRCISQDTERNLQRQQIILYREVVRTL